MGKEFELKYGLNEKQASEISDCLRKESFRILEMQTTYYDTPAGDLRSRRWTLRLRLENGVPVCTVKTPAGKFSRGEWEVQCGDITHAIPQLCRAGCPDSLLEYTKGGVFPICGARFTRICRTAEICGSVVELSLDRGILTGGKKQQSLLEFEVELKSGTEENAMLAAKKFADAYSLTLESRSKFSRALALAKGE